LDDLIILGPRRILSITRWGCSSKTNKLILFGFGAVCWSLWKVRNKMAIDKQIVKSPKIIFFNIISIMQRWSVLLPAHERDRVAATTEKIKKKVAA
jgi:hypothetical protein